MRLHSGALAVGDVGRIAHDDVPCVVRGGLGAECIFVAEVDAHAQRLGVGAGHVEGGVADVRSRDAGERQTAREGDRYAPAARADIKHAQVGAVAPRVGNEVDEAFGLGTRYEHGGRDAQVHAVEACVARDVLHGLAAEHAPHHAGEARHGEGLQHAVGMDYGVEARVTSRVLEDGAHASLGLGVAERRREHAEHGAAQLAQGHAAFSGGVSRRQARHPRPTCRSRRCPRRLRRPRPMWRGRCGAGPRPPPARRRPARTGR